MPQVCLLQEGEAKGAGQGTNVCGQIRPSRMTWASHLHSFLEASVCSTIKWENWIRVFLVLVFELKIT